MTGLEEALSLEAVLAGLARDLEELRAGRISIQQAEASAHLAKQFMNGVRLVVNTRRHIEEQARLVDKKREARA